MNTETYTTADGTSTRIVNIAGRLHILAPDASDVMTFWRLLDVHDDQPMPIEDEATCDPVIWQMILSRFAPEV